MSWKVILFMPQTGHPGTQYSVNCDVDNNLTVYTGEKYKPRQILVDDSEFNNIIKDPWYPIPKDIKQITISTPTHLTIFQRQKPAFNAKKKRAVKSKSKSKSRRKSRSPRRV